MYKHIFGPVPSRRLGISLGVDVVPFKICSLNCIYCECGSTTKLTNTREEYVSYKEIISELEHYLNNNPQPDFVTFSGSGEPTLNLKIGDVLKFLKIKHPDISVAVLTNGTTLVGKQVYKEILAADLVLPSLDAATDKTFQRINRPHKSINIKDVIQGLINFRKDFRGEIWLEVFIIPGYNNNSEDLQSIKEAIIKIKPDRIQLNTLDRPGVLKNLKPANKDELQKVIDFWQLKNIEIIGSVENRKTVGSYCENIEETILETISRRPCTVEDLKIVLGIHINEINKYLGVLEGKNMIHSVRQKRGIFYQTNHD